MVLRETLEALISKSGDAGSCRFGRLLNNEIDQETAVVLKSAMKSNASTRSIWLALQGEGIVIDRATVTAARQCFRGEKSCSCGHGPEGGAE
jgi:hypothetical protein